MGGAADGRGDEVGGTPQRGGEDTSGGCEADDLRVGSVRDHRRIGTGAAREGLGGAADGDEGYRKGVHGGLQGSATSVPLQYVTALYRSSTVAPDDAEGDH